MFFPSDSPLVSDFHVSGNRRYNRFPGLDFSWKKTVVCVIYAFWISGFACTRFGFPVGYVVRGGLKWKLTTMFTPHQTLCVVRTSELLGFYSKETERRLVEPLAQPELTFFECSLRDHDDFLAIETWAVPAGGVNGGDEDGGTCWFEPRVKFI